VCSIFARFRHPAECRSTKDTESPLSEGSRCKDTKFRRKNTIESGRIIAFFHDSEYDPDNSPPGRGKGAAHPSHDGSGSAGNRESGPRTEEKVPAGAREPPRRGTIGRHGQAEKSCLQQFRPQLLEYRMFYYKFAIGIQAISKFLSYSIQLRLQRVPEIRSIPDRALPRIPWRMRRVRKRRGPDRHLPGSQAGSPSIIRRAPCRADRHQSNHAAAGYLFVILRGYRTV